MDRWFARFAVLLVGLLWSSPALSADAAPPQARTLQDLWRQAEQAREFSLHAPWRADEPWQRAHERLALWEIIRQAPGGLDEARARLRLAELISPAGRPRNSLARHHYLLAGGILRRLMAEGPGAEGLTWAAGMLAAQAGVHSFANDDANTLADAEKYLRGRWKGGGRDAPEAGFLLARLLRDGEKRLQMCREVVQKFPDSPWTPQTQLLAAWTATCEQSVERRKPREAFLHDCLALADKYGQQPMAAVALAWAGNYVGSGDIVPYLREEQETPFPRWTRAMEIYLRLAREHPPGGEWRAADQLGLAPPTVPGLYVSKAQFAGGHGVEKIQQLFREFYALRPAAEQRDLLDALLYTQGFRPGTYELAARRVRYLLDFWAAVEKLTPPAKLPEHLLYRAWFFEKWARLTKLPGSLVQRDYNAASIMASEEVLRLCGRLLRDYPADRYAAPALDLLALHYLTGRQRGQTVGCWRRLLAEYPDQPVAPSVALNLAEITVGTGAGQAWRDAVSQAARRFDKDPVLAALAPAIRAESLAAEYRMPEAVAEYQAAERALAIEPFRPLVLEARIGDPLSNGPELVGTSADRWEIARTLADWAPHAPAGYKDLSLWMSIEWQAGEQRLATLRKIAADYPASPAASLGWIAAGLQREDANQLADASAAYQAAIQAPHTPPAHALAARMYAAGLHYSGKGLPAPPAPLAQAASLLIKELGDERFRTRAAAAGKLAAMGPPVAGLLADATRSRNPQIAALAAEVMDRIAVAQVRAALESHHAAMNETQPPDELQRDLAGLHALAWDQLATVPRIRETLDARQWCLIDSTLEVWLADGTRRQIDVSYPFRSFRNAACMRRLDVDLLAGALGLQNARPIDDESRFTRNVVRKLVLVSQPTTYVIRRRRFVFPARPIVLGPAATIQRVRFLNDERTRAEVGYSFGLRGGTINCWKVDGTWHCLPLSGEPTTYPSSFPPRPAN